MFVAAKVSAIMGPACVTGISAAVIGLLELAAISAQAAGPADQVFSIPAPVITPIVGYGTIFTGVIAIIGMVGLFYGMKYSLNSALDDLKEMKVDIKKISEDLSELRTSDEVLRERVRSNSDRLHNVEDQIYQASIGIDFGRIAAVRNRAIEGQRGRED